MAVDAYGNVIPESPEMTGGDSLLEKIAHNTWKTQDYIFDAETDIKEIKNLLMEGSDMGESSRVAEIIAARDRGDMGDGGGMGLGGGLGGVLLGGILAGGFGFGGRNDGGNCAVSNCQNALTEVLSDFNAQQHGQTLDAIHSSTAAGVAATQHASQIEQLGDVSRAVCGVESVVQNGFGITNFNVAKGFADLDKSNCIAFATTNSNINEQGFRNLLGQKDLAMQLAECCCDMKTTTIEQAQSVKDLINCNTMQDLRDKNDKLFLELSQCKQTAELSDLKNDIARQGDTVIAIGNTLNTIITAVNSLVSKG